MVKAKEILKDRGEEEVLEKIKTVKKADDLADTLLQLMSFKYLCFVDKSI